MCLSSSRARQVAAAAGDALHTRMLQGVRLGPIALAGAVLVLTGCLSGRLPGSSRYRDSQGIAAEPAGGGTPPADRSPTGTPAGAGGPASPGSESADGAVTPSPSAPDTPSQPDPLAVIEFEAMVAEVAEAARAKAVASVQVAAIVDETGERRVDERALTERLTVTLANQLPAEIPVYAPARLVEQLEQSGRDRSALRDLAVACELAKRAGAAACVWGTIAKSPSGAGYTITLQLLDTTTRAFLGGAFRSTLADRSGPLPGGD